jgi:voltage-dependent potassium channel beta subunit
LGRAGLKVSVLSYGSWVTFSDQVGLAGARECLAVARELGINFFDTAEAYGNGRAECVLGTALRDLGWDRATYVVSTKLYWGLHDCVNLRKTLNRKYLFQAIDGCLERLKMGFVDLLFCHRPDPETPIDEVVWAMSDIVASGKALYWGTSEWGPGQIRSAWDIADRYGLRKPTMEQVEYNLFSTTRLDQYAALRDELGLGLTTWSPLASGALTGKYRNGIPSASRASLPGYGWLSTSLTDPGRNEAVDRLLPIASELGYTAAQLAIAWCTMNPAVSTVILGASTPEQVRENVGALDLVPTLSRDVMAQIEKAVG